MDMNLTEIEGRGGEGGCKGEKRLAGLVFVYSDLRLSGTPPGRGAGGGVRTRDSSVPADLRVDSLATVPPTPPQTGGVVVCEGYLGSGRYEAAPSVDCRRYALLSKQGKEACHQLYTAGHHVRQLTHLHNSNNNNSNNNNNNSNNNNNRNNTTNNSNSNNNINNNNRNNTTNNNRNNNNNNRNNKNSNNKSIIDNIVNNINHHHTTTTHLHPSLPPTDLVNPGAE
ncbi:hypothetical protein PoB_005969900 [Plakobranchus ocellatus]|uniref:Uncharacterized protein n=1 Tax=Plakobranchus ocellatus TaxID=259542 RepID=A0AAV4CNE3_9GAST|nr:hypothetical protein PoB_005969900 [Plakobranchus ocellatus]